MLATATAETARQQSRDEDRWLRWPTVVTTLTVFSLTFVCGLPGIVSFVLIPLAVLGYIMVVPALAVLGVWLAMKRQPRKAGSVVFAIAVPVLLSLPIRWTTNCLHLGVTVGFGAGQIGSELSPDGKFGVYDWSTGLAGGPNTFLVYDETDKIIAPLSAYGHGALVRYNIYNECVGQVDHLLGHYYICTL